MSQPAEQGRLPGPAYRIETPRLVVRGWNPADAPKLKTAVDENIEYLKEFMVWAHKEPTDLQTKIDLLRLSRSKFDLGEDFVYGILSADESEVIGGTGLHTRQGPNIREIGYWIAQKHSGQGLATEVSAALIRVAFEIDGVTRLEIRHDSKNAASAAVIRKLGLTCEGVLRASMKTHDGGLRDQMVWSLLVAEYPTSPAARLQVRAFDAAGRELTLRPPTQP
jgi:RimJ/RimL family protein N-acetyltransferase